MRRLAVLVFTPLVAAGFLVPAGTAAASVDEPRSQQATFVVKEASCGFSPEAHEIEASGKLRSKVHELPNDNREHYLKVTLRVEHSTDGGPWQRLVARKSFSNAFWGDDLTFPWTATIHAEVKAGIANTHDLSLKYRVQLMQVRKGIDKPIWRHNGRSATFACEDG